jgi:hypothetical protein
MDCGRGRVLVGGMIICSATVTGLVSDSWAHAQVSARRSDAGTAQHPRALDRACEWSLPTCPESHLPLAWLCFACPD